MYPQNLTKLTNLTIGAAAAAAPPPPAPVPPWLEALLAAPPAGPVALEPGITAVDPARVLRFCASVLATPPGPKDQRWRHVQYQQAQRWSESLRAAAGVKVRLGVDSA
jgi:hypothetical protein